MYELHTRKHAISTIGMQILRMRITLNGVRGLATFPHTRIFVWGVHIHRATGKREREQERKTNRSSNPLVFVDKIISICCYSVGPQHARLFMLRSVLYCACSDSAASKEQNRWGRGKRTSYSLNSVLLLVFAGEVPLPGDAQNEPGGRRLHPLTFETSTMSVVWLRLLWALCLCQQISGEHEGNG